MSIKSRSFGWKMALISFAFTMMLFASQSTFAQGITLEKDVFLQSPIQSAEDLPDAVTVSLYDSKDAVVPLATQSFSRGNYVLDFDFNKSDGLSSGSVARFKVDFTNKLNLDNATDEAKQPKEIWAELSINDTVIGDRTRIPDEPMVQLLLASDASISTYLTLAYTGDGNPITSIYRDLPLSTAAGRSADEYITSMFKTYAAIDPYAPSLDAAIVGDTVNGNLTVTGKLFTNGAVAWGAAPLVLGQTLGNRGIVVTDKAASNPKNIYIGWSLNQEYAEVIALQEGIATKNIVFNVAKVGVGTAAPAYTLAVNGTIGCKELTVTSAGWADFVFGNDYRLRSLEEVETFISTNKHLPGIPTAAEVKEQGVGVGDMSAKLLQKVEELTLYVIDLKKENNLLKAQLATVQKQVQEMER